MEDITLSVADIRKLLGGKNGDAALLYLCCKAGGTPEQSGLGGTRLESAAAFLRQVGLWQPQTPRFQQSAEPPVYTEADVLKALEAPGTSFRALEGETQRRLGRVLSVEELKILLAMSDYLGLSNEVISILLSYCIDRSRSRGAGRLPSFRTIEKEAYRWADEGIDNIETAAAYVQAQTVHRTKVSEICRMMGLDRNPTVSEEKYIRSWLLQGFGLAEIRLAFEKTCQNTGFLKWPYMNSILKSWDGQGLHTVEQIQRRDKPGKAAAAKQNSFQRHGEALSPLMQQAAARIMADDTLEEQEG